jgi:hypothetical protein
VIFLLSSWLIVELAYNYRSIGSFVCVKGANDWVVIADDPFLVAKALEQDGFVALASEEDVIDSSSRVQIKKLQCLIHVLGQLRKSIKSGTLV